MQLTNPFDYTTVEPSFGFPLIPADWYPVIVKEDTPETTDDGGRLILWLEVINHPSFPHLAQFAGQKLRWQLNLYSKNQQSAKISWQQFSALCHAIRVPGPIQATEQLRNIPFAVRVSNDGTYNNVKELKTIDGQAVGKAGPVVAAPAPAPTYPPVAAAPVYAVQPPAPPAWAPPGAPPVPPAVAAPPVAASPWGNPPAQLVAQPPAPPAGAPPAAPWGNPGAAAPPASAPPTWPGR